MQVLIQYWHHHNNIIIIKVLNHCMCLCIKALVSEQESTCVHVLGAYRQDMDKLRGYSLTPNGVGTCGSTTKIGHVCTCTRLSTLNN